MKRRAESGRRRFLGAGLAAAGSLVVAGCEKLSRSEWFPSLLGAGETLNRPCQQAMGGRRSMAQEFSPADLSPDFRSNGTSMPENPQYQAMVANAFASYQLKVDGLVAK